LLNDLKPSLITNFVGVVNDTQDECMKWNCYFPRDILRAAVSSSPKAKILLIGSAAEYGLRDNPAPIAENSPLLGTTPYALSKIAQNNLLEQPEFARLSILYARVFNVWGVGMGATTLPGSLFDQLSKASSQPLELRIRDCNSVRDFISVEKVCSLFYEALTLLQNPTYLNFASGLPMTVGEFSLRIISAVSTQIAENTALEVSSAPTYSVADVSRLNSFLFDILKFDP
jgi:nucleoside-diphosphate-sugar epimerase